MRKAGPQARISGGAPFGLCGDPLVSDCSAIIARVRALLAQVLDVPASSIGPESSTATIASWSSLNHLMLISEIENEFGVVFSNQRIRDLVTFDRIVSAVAAQLGTSSSD